MVLATVCTIFAVYFLVLIWARKADMLDERKVDFIVDTSSSYMKTRLDDHLCFFFALFYQMEVVQVPVF